MSMPVLMDKHIKVINSKYRCVSPKQFLYSIAIVRLASNLSYTYACGDFCNGLLILAACMCVEVICPACYSLLSLCFPLLMAMHAVYLQDKTMISLRQTILLMPITIGFIGIPMSICLHRFFSHQAFATSRGMHAVFAIVSCLAFQGGPLWWAVMHARHHKNCDKEDDPHSISKDGFWYSFLGWTVNPTNYRIDVHSLQPGVCFPETQVIQKIHNIFPVLLCLLVCHHNGYACMLWSVLIPMLMCRLITLLFNLEFHPAIVDEKQCKSINDDRFLAKIVGESRHEDHHKTPRRSRRPDWDLAYFATLYWMKPLGLVWDCR